MCEPPPTAARPLAVPSDRVSDSATVADLSKAVAATVGKPEAVRRCLRVGGVCGCLAAATCA